MIIPLANDIDEAELGEAVKNCPDDDMRKKWQTDYKSLMKIKKRGQSSLEIGVVRTLLAHIVERKSQNDDCAKILMNHIEKHLTSAGKTALMQEEMLGVIDKTSLEKYRVPGGHTGYLPFSVAKEARDYVKRNLELIETWFE